MDDIRGATIRPYGPPPTHHFVPAAIAVLLLAGCGGPPTAKEILAKPANSSLKDAHVTLTGHISSGAFSMDVTGDGTFIWKPRPASDLRVQGSLGAIPIAIEYLSIDGKDYQRTGSEKWTATTSSPGNDWSDAKNASLAGEEILSEGKSWHVKATGADGKPFQVWVRESDGFPLKFSGAYGDNGSINLLFDKFNTGASVSPPAASDIKPAAKDVTANVGETVALNQAAVTVVSANLNFNSADQYNRPTAGNRFVVVEVLYENTGTDKLAYNPFDWKLTDSSGFSYDHGYAGKGPELHSGDLAPGEKARGFITYEVPTSAAGLTLKLTLGDDTLTVSLS